MASQLVEIRSVAQVLVFQCYSAENCTSIPQTITSRVSLLLLLSVCAYRFYPAVLRPNRDHEPSFSMVWFVGGVVGRQPDTRNAESHGLFGLTTLDAGC